MALVDSYEDRIASGKIEDWTTFVTRNYGYSGYQVRPYGFIEARDYILRSEEHIRKTVAAAGEPFGAREAALI